MGRITSAEMAQLWAQFMNDSGSSCILSYFLEKAEDDEIRSIIKQALELSKSHITKLTTLFKDENHAIPNGFTLKEDVNLHAPRLYSDNFALYFIHLMAKIGITNYAASVTSSSRKDIIDYFEASLNETIDLYKASRDLLVERGLYIKSPSIPNLTEAEYVEKQGYILDVFGDKRPLIASEIGNLFSNIQRNALGAATLTGFSQVAQSREVTQFFLRGIEIAKKHIRLLGEKLEESDLPIPSAWSTEVTSSTSKTFSDRLMTFFTSGMIGLSVGFYGTAVAQSPRLDIGVMYNRLSLEIQLYSEDGANIMIKNHWLEQPPMAADRHRLASKKEQ